MCSAPPSRASDRLPASVAAALCGVLLAVAALPGSARALDPGPGPATAVVTQDGWWNRLQGPQEGEPEGNPLRTAAPPLPAPPTVPADAIAAAAVDGETIMVAAIGIDVVLPPDGRLDSLTLRLKEAPAPGANINSEAAPVVACPAVTPWGGHKNAAWQDRPEADCSLSRADGERADDGTWTFDLTPLGVLWTDPFAPLMQNGVVLAVDVEASPGAAHVSWLDMTTGEVVVDLVAGVAPATESPAPAPPTEDTPPSTAAAPPPAEAEYGPAGFDAPTFGATPPSFPDPVPFSTGSAPSFPTRPVDPAPPAEERPTTPTAAAQAPPPPAAAPRPPAAVGFWEGIPAATALLIPVAVGLALLVGLALGPGGRPMPVWPRAGGLSRALARRAGGDPVV